MKHGSSPTQCAVTTPKVGHSPQAGPGLRDSVVSIELCNFESIIFYTLGVAGVLETSLIGKKRRPGYDPAERLSGQVATTPQRDYRGRWLCRCEASFVVLYRGVSFGVLFLACSGSEGATFLQISSMAGVLETSSIGERRRPASL